MQGLQGTETEHNGVDRVD